MIVVGAGWGGYTAASTLAQHGAKVALVEQDKVGGVCLHRGCIPTKALLEAAATLGAVQRADRVGITSAKPRLDWKRTLAFKQAVVDRLHRGMESGLQLAKVERVAGAARMVAPQAVVVTPPAGAPDVRIDAGALVIATGSAPSTLPFLPLDGARIVTSDEAVSLPPPRRAIIVGGGVIGMEFASLWCDLGGEVTVLELEESVLPGEDRDTARGLAKALRARGVVIETGAAIDPQSVRVTTRSVRLSYRGGDGVKTATGNLLLVAVGRRPASGALAPAGAGVRTEREAVPVDAGMRTNLERVYAVGDVTGGLQLAHVAAAQGRYVAETLLEQGPPPLDPQWMPRVVYSRPQVASIGLTEAQARAAGHGVQVGRAHFRASGRALIRGEEGGFAKLIGDAESGDLLGAHVLGPEATEIIGQVSVAGFLDASLWELAHAVQPHPTMSEAVTEAAQAALRPKVRLT